MSDEEEILFKVGDQVWVKVENPDDPTKPLARRATIKALSIRMRDGKAWTVASVQQLGHRATFERRVTAIKAEPLSGLVHTQPSGEAGRAFVEETVTALRQGHHHIQRARQIIAEDTPAYPRKKS